MVAVHAALGRWKGSSAVQEATGQGVWAVLSSSALSECGSGRCFKQMEGRLGDATSNVLGGVKRNEMGSGWRKRAVL